jgi:rubredoxin
VSEVILPSASRGLDSAILQVVAEHDVEVGEAMEVGESYLSPVHVHSAIRWRWSWMTDPEDARDVFDRAQDLAERGLLEELPPRSGFDPFIDYRITETGHIFLRDNPPPHPCVPPQGSVVAPPMDWICPHCGAVFRTRIRHYQFTLHEPSGDSHRARWEKVRDGAA